jgi:hypothetical protein
MVEFMKQGTTISSQVYQKTLNEKLRRPIQSKRHGMLMFSIVLFHDIAHPHTAAYT